ncbi:hypothetical protein [Sorangium sp. So ce128]|uniref:hypothetical protein n=1 Tax=Sorangium sp. So ce128 TaxID=3133281 RepID=UPI003F63D85A
MSATPPNLLAINWTPLAKLQLTEIRSRADKNPHGFEGAVLAILRGTIANGLARPSVAFHPANELKNRRHDFSGVRRAKINNASRGVRIFYLASASHNALTLLMLGERRVGRPEDAYETLASHIDVGDFDTAFAAFSMSRPVVAQPVHGMLMSPSVDPWSPVPPVS